MTAEPNAAVTELARYQNPHTKEWWRIVRFGPRDCSLESISERSLERGLCWAHACLVEFDYGITEERVCAEMEAYLALAPSARMRDAAPDLSKCKYCGFELGHDEGWVNRICDTCRDDEVNEREDLDCDEVSK
jgi:hypothetical protein